MKFRNQRFATFVSFYAPEEVSATWIDDKGEVLGRNLTRTPEATEIFHKITVKNPFQNDKWKLKLESGTTDEGEIMVTDYIDFNSAY